MLPEEQAANSRYFYELASAMFGYSEETIAKVQAFHFKGGQGAKTGTGGHLPGAKNIGKISQVRGITEGEPAISPPTFKDLVTVADFKRFGDRVREVTGAAPEIFRDHISVPTIPALARARAGIWTSSRPADG